ncbi:MAG: dihydrofolate reductase, partial [Clostridia bacterium]|nr:dihydrofolate reductase [Clostridia bacterium]
NIVLFPGGEKREDCTVVETLDEVFAEIKKYEPDDVFIIGGAMFYKTMLPYCSEVLVTKVDADGDAEVFYENLDKLDNWSLTSESEQVETNGYKIKFTVYKNSNVKNF